LYVSLTSQFKLNPVKFLKSHRLLMKEIKPGHRFTRKNHPNQVAKFSMNGHIDLRVDEGDKGDLTTLGVKTLHVIEATADCGVRALPWVEPDLSSASASGTYMKLDAAAQFFVTGPIEGCFVYVATRGNVLANPDIYIFHVNANGVGGHANAIAKDGLVRPILVAKGLTIRQRLSHADYTKVGSTCQGFVYGWKAAGKWNFQVHSLQMVGKTKQITPTYAAFTPKKFSRHIDSMYLPGCTVL
jgi:hypothetical protein